MLPRPLDGKSSIGDIRVGLDIGASKICVAVAERFRDGTIQVLGIGMAPSRGVTRHGIVDCEAAAPCVRAALIDAEIKSNVMIRNVLLAVPGGKVAPFGSGLTWDSIFEWEKICYTAQTDGILQPVSLRDCTSAPGLHVVYGAHDRIQNSIRCLEGLGVEVERSIFAPIASAAALVCPIDKERGILVIDIGEGMTHYAVYSGGALVQSDCLPIGGRQIANDLSRDLRIPEARAQRLVIEEGSVWLDVPTFDDYQRVVLAPEPGFSGGEIEREMMNAIIHQGVCEILNRVKRRLINTGVRLDSLGGVRLSGGCYRIQGIEHLALEIFDLFPASRFRMRGIEAEPRILTDPRLACAVGLVNLPAPIGS